jgi:hypothetical protein
VSRKENNYGWTRINADAEEEGAKKKRKNGKKMEGKVNHHSSAFPFDFLFSLSSFPSWLPAFRIVPFLYPCSIRVIRSFPIGQGAKKRR